MEKITDLPYEESPTEYLDLWMHLKRFAHRALWVSDGWRVDKLVEVHEEIHRGFREGKSEKDLNCRVDHHHLA